MFPITLRLESILKKQLGLNKRYIYDQFLKYYITLLNTGLLQVNHLGFYLIYLCLF